jgi:hypothetical protein
LIDSGNSDRSVPVFSSLWRQPARRNVVPALLAQGEAIRRISTAMHISCFILLFTGACRFLGRSAIRIGML